MKLRIFVTAFALLAAGITVAQDVSSERGQLSYAIGYEVGRDLAERGMEVDIATVARALQDGHAQRDPAVAEETMRDQLTKMQERMRDEAMTKFRKLAEENKTKSDRFMSENRGKRGIIALPSGVQYRVIEEGTGSRPKLTSEVSVHYRGSLSSGLEFDSSFARGVPATFQVDQVLQGWQEVLPLMRVGDYWQVFLPPELAYGERGQPPIGPNEALVFDIKLVEVK